MLQYVLNNTSHTDDESFFKNKIQYQTRLKILQKIPYQYHANMNLKNKEDAIKVPIGMLKRQQYLPNTNNN
jgi:hypothetical protein